MGHSSLNVSLTYLRRIEVAELTEEYMLANIFFIGSLFSSLLAVLNSKSIYHLEGLQYLSHHLNL